MDLKYIIAIAAILALFMYVGTSDYDDAVVTDQIQAENNAGRLSHYGPAQ